MKLTVKPYSLLRYADALTTAQILTGSFTAPIKIISTYSSEDFEIFTSEWVTACKSNLYKTIQKCGGAGDFGRDIIAFYPDKSWDNYQCKRYANPLTPSDAYVEIAKHIYYSYIGEYSPATKYYFICSKDVGPKLIDLLKNSHKLKKALEENWEKSCSSEITSIKKIQLFEDRKFKEFFDNFDFTIFESYPLQKIIEEHSGTKHYAARFGGGLRKTRTMDFKTPSSIHKSEHQYVEKLFEIYGEKLGQIITNSNLRKFKNELLHFERQREAYFSAETLKEFARDNVIDTSSYDELLKDFYDIIIEVVDSDHETGFKRLLEAIKASSSVSINRHILNQEIKPLDRKGICHQLANTKEDIKWKK